MKKNLLKLGGAVKKPCGTIYYLRKVNINYWEYQRLCSGAPSKTSLGNVSQII